MTSEDLVMIGGVNIRTNAIQNATGERFHTALKHWTYVCAYSGERHFSVMINRDHVSQLLKVLSPIFDIMFSILH